MTTLDLIKDITNDKKKRKISPCYATSKELFTRSTKTTKELKIDLIKLIKQGVIKKGVTLNHLYFYFPCR